jgi:hypothetical protein
VDHDDVLQIVAAMRKGSTIDLDEVLALPAAESSVATKLALADSIMLATALSHWARS